MFDFRSDTLTQPTPAMRKAMSGAEVGDDVFDEDPTIHALEEETAALLGTEAALFVPSGTMSNQIAMGLLGRPGTEILVEEGAHVMNYEGGAVAALWGVTLRTAPGEEGRLHPSTIRDAVRPVDSHVAPVVAVSVENTHNRAGGAVWSPEQLDAVARAASELGLPVHLDGARIWNAAEALNVPESRLTRGMETISVCFSKGLGAPVGSALASTRERIRRARFLRKRLGGGMRQAGILAAGALHGLRHHRERLVDDHRRATRLGEAASRLPGVDVLPVRTNIVILELSGTGRSQQDVVEALQRESVRVIGFGPTRIRMVTHLDIGDDAVERATSALSKVLGGRS